MVAHTMVVRVTIPTKNVCADGIEPGPVYPTKRGHPSAISCNPDMETINPVTSGGNKTRSLLAIRDNTPDTNPAEATIPNRSDNPPVRTARMEEGRYVRELENGQK